MTKRKWTHHLIKEDARKYSSIKEWRTQSSAAYHAAHKRGIYEEVTAHMTASRITWTKQAVLDDAKGYATRGEWAAAPASGYQIAHRNGWLDEACSHMERNRRPSWNKDTALKSAARYKSKAEWKQDVPSGYNYARKNGFLEEACAHMTAVGHRYKRCVYMIAVKNTTFIYVGLTQNFEKRIAQHFSHTKKVMRLVEVFGEDSIICTRLSEYVENEVAQELESKLVTEYSKMGYDVLNTAKPGGLGQGREKWAKEAVLADAKKYDMVSKWVRESPGAFNAAYRHGVYHQATQHMGRGRKPYRYWTKKRVCEDAKCYETIPEWREKSEIACSIARKKGWMDEATAHMNRPAVLKGHWDEQAVHKDALNYSTRTAWRIKSGGAYSAAHRNGWIESATRHMVRGKRRSQWEDKRKVILDAKKFSGRSQWRENSRGAYEAAKKGGYLEEACAHMRNPKKKAEK